MAVYTVLERDQIESLIKPFGIGPLIDYQGVAEGIENTNYFITTDHSHLADEELTDPQQQYVLTLFEELEPEDLPFYVQLTTAFNHGELPVPCPLTDYNGDALQLVNNKPALLFPRAKGEFPTVVSSRHCEIIGEALARMHLLSQQLPLQHKGNRNIEWLKTAANQALAFVEPKEEQLIHQQVDELIALIETKPDLPVGIVHSDLFRDNTLFDGDELNGIIDFYNASTDYLLLDLAVTVNDWCSNADGSLNQSLSTPLLQAYASQRPFHAAERAHWNTFLRVYAMRFWVSRLLAQHLPRGGHHRATLQTHKDPNQYKAILLQRISQTHQLP